MYTYVNGTLSIPPFFPSCKSERENWISYINTYIWNLERTYLQGRHRGADIGNRLIHTSLFTCGSGITGHTHFQSYQTTLLSIDTVLIYAPASTEELPFSLHPCKLNSIKLPKCCQSYGYKHTSFIKNDGKHTQLNFYLDLTFNFNFNGDNYRFTYIYKKIREIPCLINFYIWI